MGKESKHNSEANKQALKEWVNRVKPIKELTPVAPGSAMGGAGAVKEYKTDAAAAEIQRLQDQLKAVVIPDDATNKQTCELQNQIAAIAAQIKNGDFRDVNSKLEWLSFQCSEIRNRKAASEQWQARLDRLHDPRSATPGEAKQIQEMRAQILSAIQNPDKSDPSFTLDYLEETIRKINDAHAVRDRWLGELDKLKTTFSAGGMPEELSDTFKLKLQTIERMIDAKEDPRREMASLCIHMDEAKATHAQSKVFAARLDAIPFPPKPPATDKQLDELKDFQYAVRAQIAAGINPEAALVGLRRRAAEIQAVNANSEMYLQRLTAIPAPNIQLTEKQGRELEGVRHQIIELVKAGQNPESLLDGLVERIKEIEHAHSAAEENLSKVTDFEGELETHIWLTDKQKVALHNECAEIRILIEAGHDPKDHIKDLKQRLTEMETIKFSRDSYEEMLKRQVDPADATPKQAAFLASQRAEIRKMLDDEVYDAKYLLDDLESYLWQMEENHAKARDNAAELAKLVDPAGATPKQHAVLLEVRMQIEAAFDEGGNVSRAIADLRERIKEVVAVNTKREAYREELADIRLPRGISDEKAALLEMLRIQVQDMLAEGANPRSILNDLRKECGLEEIEEAKPEDEDASAAGAVRHEAMNT